MGGALSGKTVLVTGASAGIGKAAAIALAEAGAKIIATGRRKQELDALVRQCGGAVTEAIAGDLNDAQLRRGPRQARAGRRHSGQQCRHFEIRAADGHDRR